LAERDPRNTEAEVAERLYGRSRRFRVFDSDRRAAEKDGEGAKSPRGGRSSDRAMDGDEGTS
jgi:hypothetical protein